MAIKEKTIPTIIALVFLVIIVIVTTYLSGLLTTFGSKASSDCSPISIQLTNLTYHSVDISFITSNKCSVSLNFNDRIISDVFQPKNPKSIIHYFQLNNLSPSTEYNYSIIAEAKKIKNDSFHFKTPVKLEKDPSATNLAWGKILNSDEKPANMGIVYLNIPGASPMSSFVTSAGNWNIPLSVSYNESKDAWFSPTLNTEEEIILLSDSGQSTLVTGNSSKNNPVDDIIIGQGFALPEDNNFSDNGYISKDQNQVFATSPKKITITNPVENETLNTSTPQFFGTATPNQSIQIYLDQQSPKQIESDSKGRWQWAPIYKLLNGQHILKVSLTELESVSLKRKFEILASDSGSGLGLGLGVGPAFIASTSAQASPTLIPTKIPTSTTKPTLVPTKIVRVAKASTKSKIPNTGFTLPTILPLIFSIPAITIAFFLI
ncbi:hypothetical protein DRH14_04790 [Candidatus Shapirobacteria bacterium]|nr:MAG: hypothetical protein DRH14_04790 [Candidatus Shapirobacteria bacterium]